MIDHITANLPAGITLTSFSGQATPPVAGRRPRRRAATPTTESDRARRAPDDADDRPRRRTPPPTISGTITFQGNGEGLPDARRAGSTRWARCPQISNVYVDAARSEVADGRRRRPRAASRSRRPPCSTPAAQSDRLNELREGGEMKTKNMMVGILAAVLVARAVVDDAPQADARARRRRCAPRPPIAAVEARPARRRSSRKAQRRRGARGRVQGAARVTPAGDARLARARGVHPRRERHRARPRVSSWQSVTHGPPTVGVDGVDVDHARHPGEGHVRAGASTT